MAFASFMSSATGRIIRIVAGLALIGWGIYLAVEASNLLLGIILAVVGLLPLVAGLLNICVLAPLFRAPFRGTNVRAQTK